MSKFDFKGKVVLIAGGGKNLGGLLSTMDAPFFHGQEGPDAVAYHKSAAALG